VIIEHDVGARIRGESVSEANDRKRAGEDGSPGPSKRRTPRTQSTIKKEYIAGSAANARAQRIQALQVSRVIIGFGTRSRLTAMDVG
jgi:hypothetical protein